MFKETLLKKLYIQEITHGKLRRISKYVNYAYPLKYFLKFQMIQVVFQAV